MYQLVISRALFDQDTLVETSIIMPSTPAATDIRRDFVAAFWQIIDDEYKTRKRAGPRLATDANVNLRTAHFWLQHSHLPAVPQLLTLMRNNRRVREAVYKLFDQTGSS